MTTGVNVCSSVCSYTCLSSVIFFSLHHRPCLCRQSSDQKDSYSPLYTHNRQQELSLSFTLTHTYTQTHCTSIGSVQLFNMRQLPLHHLASPISARSKSNKRQSFQVTLHCTFVSSTSVHTYRTPLSPPS